MSNNEKKLEKTLNIIIRKKYPFIQKIEVVRISHLFTELRSNIDFFITKKFLKDHVKYECYDQMEKDDDIFFSLFSFNYCSDVKIDEEYIYNLFESVYTMMGLSSVSVHSTNLSLSVLVLE